MIELESLKRVYSSGASRVEALAGVNLKVADGEFLAVMGPSGSGKSTLLNIIGCLDRPTSGRYILKEREVEGLGDQELSAIRNLSFGFVFQSFHLLPRLSVLKNVMLPLVYAPEFPENAAQRAQELLSRVGLGGRTTALPGQLSGGQMQRVAIARALINRPAAILADEPTGNLDQKSGAEIMKLFKEFNRDGRSVILVTHDPQVAEQASRVLVMQDGRVVEDRGGQGGGQK
jgi:putative ABC transport system ATP-binding protein